MSNLFLMGCIPARLLIVCLAYLMLNMDMGKNLFHLFLTITFAIGVGFWTIYMMDWRKTGIEVGGEKIWWNSLRPVHGTIYLLFTLLAFMGYKEAWLFLLADTFIGLAAYFHHYSNSK
jgi:hypothetical protein